MQGAWLMGTPSGGYGPIICTETCGEAVNLSVEKSCWVDTLGGLDNTIQAQLAFNTWTASRGSKTRQPQYSTLAGCLGEAVGYLIFFLQIRRLSLLTPTPPTTLQQLKICATYELFDCNAGRHTQPHWAATAHQILEESGPDKQTFF